MDGCHFESDPQKEQRIKNQGKRTQWKKMKNILDFPFHAENSIYIFYNRKKLQ
jgi:hypothetical protein